MFYVLIVEGLCQTSLCERHKRRRMPSSVSQASGTALGIWRSRGIFATRRTERKTLSSETRLNRERCA
ncbi:MAG: hypothetical protein IJY15_03685 [Thermoguttaceae bacterium]|nr:hypothetical protein [Thermoguttaceae bacterium]